MGTWHSRIAQSHTHTHTHTHTQALTFICIRTFYSIIKVSTLKVHCWNRPSEFRRRIRLLASPRLGSVQDFLSGIAGPGTVNGTGTGLNTVGDHRCTLR